MTIRTYTDAELAKLPINQRNALVAHCSNNVPYADIAQALNIPIGTVRSRINRARAKIAQMRQAGANDPRPSEQIIRADRGEWERC